MTATAIQLSAGLLGVLNIAVGIAVIRVPFEYMLATGSHEKTRRGGRYIFFGCLCAAGKDSSMPEKKGELSMESKLRTRVFSLFGALLMLGTIILSDAAATAAETGKELEATRQEVKELKQTVGDLAAEVERLKQAEPAQSPHKSQDAAASKLKLGGYGEMHANFNQGSESDQVDLHRLVLYLGYDFSDWIKFHSETEIEHAYVSDGDGEISIEQAYVDFLLNGGLNVRAGRILTPLGIINKTHEPPTFNGVERPAFDTKYNPDNVGL